MYDDYFTMLADILLNKSYLLVNKHKYRLIEIEFYLKCPGHSDKYTHCHEDQLLRNTFYFHKFKTGTYKNGTFRGLDIVYGDVKTKSYFGILIRSIQKISNKKTNIIEGPCNVVNCILAEYDFDNIMDFTNGCNLNIFQNDRDFVLKPFENLPAKEIYVGPRIGLSNKYPSYQNRNYRFVINKDCIKKKKTSLKALDIC